MYKARISETMGQPGCIVLAIDQSKSMEDPWGNNAQRKSEALADMVNRLIDSILTTCTKDDKVRHYFDIGVIGYGHTVGPALSGALAGKELVSPAELAMGCRYVTRQRKLLDGAGGYITVNEELPVWLDPVAENGTPMEAALEQIERILAGWIGRYPKSYPPVVFNITDGEANHPEQAEAAAHRLKGLSTEDGEVLLFNVHIRSAAGDGKLELDFPEAEEGLSDAYARMLFRMSSQLPDPMREGMVRAEYNVGAGSRGFLYNSDPIKLIDFLEIGTGTLSGNLR
jgi:hypothetical protein